MDDTTDELFCNLVELPPCERVKALDAMTHLSTEHKAKILRMLDEADAAEEYFTGTSVAVKMLPLSSHIEDQGDMCGPYKLVSKLGEGGFGLVWLAEQKKPLRRRVAVKVVKAGMDTSEVLARFDAEKQALARMEHPNIAKVFDAGMSERGRPYFVMELVEGIPITKYCQKHALGIHERLRLFTDVCAALKHAHQKGVIHRDIKPSNVIITEIESTPVVKVIDFGIAKAIEGELTDHTLRTQAEQWVGTPAYMSPEQAGQAFGDLDTRSDIYTLGVLLYELITGVAPFDAETLKKASYDEMRRIIREEDPPRPSVRIAKESQQAATSGKSPTNFTRSSIASELDWIVLKAMEKARERRYESAAALANDVVRYLSDKPIEAKPPSPLYLLTKFAKRHRMWIHFASAFFILIVGAMLVSTWLALRAYDAEQVAQERLAAALQDRNAKNQALEEAESVSRLLINVFQRPQPGVDGRSVTALQALDTAVENLDSQLVTQSQRQTKLREVLADTYERLGIFNRSLKLREQNFQTFKKTSGLDHHTTRTALRKVIEAAEAKGDSKVALEYATLESRILREAHATPDEIETSMRSLVRAWFGCGKRQQAIKQQLDLVDYCEHEFGLNSQQDVKAKWELRQYLASNDGNSVSNKRQTPNQTRQKIDIPALEKAYATNNEIHGQVNADTIMARTKLASGLLSAGHTIEALIHLQALQFLTMDTFGPHDERTLDVQKMMVFVHIKLNQLTDAVRAQQFIVNALRERDGGQSQTTVWAENNLERRFFYSSLDKEYAEYLQDLLDRRIELFGENHVNTALVQLRAEANKTQQNLSNIQNVVKVFRERYGNESSTTSQAIAELARAYVRNARTNEAMSYYTECAPNILVDTWLNFECATFQWWMGDHEGFRETRRNILDYWERRIRTQISKPEMFDRAMWLSCIAELDNQDQKILLKRILDHVESVRAGLYIEAEERFPKPLQKQIRGTVLYRLGRYEEALASFHDSTRLMNAGQTDPSAFDYQHPSPWVYFFMAMAQHQLENNHKSEKLFDLGESRLQGSAPSRENPVLEYFLGGEPLTQWIIHSEAKALIFGE